MFIAFAALALIAAWLGKFAGLSFEFGAFVAGAVISEAAGSRTIETVVAPFRALSSRCSSSRSECCSIPRRWPASGRRSPRSVSC
jgi:hypothetical protein